MLQRAFCQPYTASQIIQTCAIQVPETCISRLPYRRFASQYRKVTASGTSGYIPQDILQTLDNNIGAVKVRVVDDQNKLGEPQHLRALLSNIDTSQYHVRRVAEGTGDVPLVKIVTKSSLLELARLRETNTTKKDVAELTKQFELNWAIDENDLGYRLTRIEEFLKDGKPVEILIAPKRRGRRAEVAEISELLRRIRETVASVPDATEWKEMQGVPGKTVEMYFKGPQQNEDRQQRLSAKDAKRSKKEAEKEARRLKEEARLAKKQRLLEEAEAEKVRLAQQMAAEADSRMKQTSPALL